MTPEEFEKSDLHSKMLDLIGSINKSLNKRLMPDIWEKFFHKLATPSGTLQGRCFMKGANSNHTWFATHCDLALAAQEVLGEK